MRILKGGPAMDDVMRPLTQELDRWAAAGRVAQVWLRDDDAVEPGAPLDRLLHLTGGFSVPVTLAVIPALTGESLAVRLEREPATSVAVHGWLHRNHAGEGEKKQELGGHRPAAIIMDELKRGFGLLERLHGKRFVPLLVPPWNRIDPALVPRLAECGFRALSVYGPEKPSVLPIVNTHVDVVDWHGTRGGRDPAALVKDAVARLRHMFDHGGSLGLLTHHLVHDQVVWDFLQMFFAATAGHPACRWCSICDLLPDHPPGTTP